MSQEQLDTRALELAKEAHSGLDTHEEICSLRYEVINSSLVENKQDIKGVYNRLWAVAGILILTLLSATAWQYQQNERDRDKFEQVVIKVLREGVKR